MAKSIGTIAAKFVADTGPFVKGVRDAEKAMNAGAGKIAADAVKMAAKTETASKRLAGPSGLLSMMRAAGRSVAGGAGSLAMGAAGLGVSGAGIAGSLATKVLGFGAAGAGLALGAGVLASKSAFSGIMDADMQARKLGLSVTELRTLMLSAGPAADAMGGAIEHFAGRLAAAKGGASDAARDFERLGVLSGKGFGPGGLADLSTAAGMTQVIERLASIPDAAQRAAMGFDLLGNRFAELAPELDRGAAGLASADRLVKQFGLGVGAADLSNIRAVSQAMRELGALKDGMFNQLALGIAPVAAEFSKLFDPKLLGVSVWKNSIIDAAEVAGLAGATVIAAWQDTSLIAKTWNAVLDQLKVGISNFIAIVMEKMADLFRSLHMSSAATGLDRWAATSRETARLHGAAANLSGDALAKDFAETQAVKNVLGFFEKVRARVGGPEAMLPHAPVPAAIAQANQAFGGMQDAARSPMEMFAQSMRQIKEMERLGKFAGNDLKDRFAHKAFADLAGAVQLPSYQGIGAATAGSREAYSAVQQHQFDSKRVTVQDQIKALIAEANRVHAENLKVGRQILDEIRKGGLEVKGL